MSSVVVRLRWTNAATGIALCGLNSALVYLFIFVLPFQLKHYYNVPLPFFYDFRGSNPAVVLIGWIILFQLYYIAYRICPPHPSRAIVTMLVGLPIFAGIVLFLMYPWGANDIYEQIFRGHIFAHYGVIPMTTTPLHFPNDPLLKYVWWKDVPGTYGPLWELINAATAKLVGTDLRALLVAYKLLADLHFWGSMVLVYATLRVVRPEFAARGFLLFAWNPFLQYEMAGNSHNDSVNLFWLVAAVALLVRKHHILALLALTVAALVKFIPALLVPLFIAALWKAHADKPVGDRLKQVGLAVVAMGMFVGLVLIPFQGPGSTLSVLALMNTYLHSSTPWYTVFTLQNLHVVGPEGQALLRNLFQLFIVLVAIWQTVRVLRGSSEPRTVLNQVLTGSYEILFWWLLVAAQWLSPWYVTWLFAFVPFLPAFGYAERAILFCFTVLGNYFIWFYRWPVGSPVGTEAETMMFWVIFPLPFLFTLGVWFFQRTRRSQQRSAVKPMVPATEV